MKQIFPDHVPQTISASNANVSRGIIVRDDKNPNRTGFIAADSENNWRIVWHNGSRCGVGGYKEVNDLISNSPPCFTFFQADI